MPQELKKVNGRWVVTGAQQSSDLVPTVRPPSASRPQPSAPRSGSSSRQPQPRPWWSKLLNDLQYELKRPWPTYGKQQPQTASQYLLNNTAIGNLAIGKGTLGQHSALGLVGATDNALKMGYSAVQRLQGRPKADANSGGFGNGLNRAVENAYRALGAKPPSQMSQDERSGDQFRRSVALNVLLAPVSPGFGAAKAVTALGMGVRGGAAFAVNEGLSTFLDDNTSGNVVNLINQFTGLNLPGAVAVGQDDMLDAAAKSFLPNAATSLGFGAAAGLAISGFKNIRRNIRSRRAVQQEAKHRARQEAMGVTQVDEAGSADFTPGMKQPVQPAPPPREPTFAEANAAMEERLGMRPKTAEAAPAAAEPGPAPIPSISNATTENFGKAKDATTQPLPEGNLDEDVWGGGYDPSLPESTTISKVWEDLSDNEINTVLSSPDVPVMDRLNQVLEARQGLNTPPPLDAGMVMAPTNNLAADYLQGRGNLEGAVSKLQGMEPWQLRSLFDPDTNPALWQRAQALSGVDEPAQLTKTDMVETLQAMSAEGQTAIPSRMMGGQMYPTQEIGVAPDVFQYKLGTDNQGVQLGSSLAGLKKWDPNAEQINLVWRDRAGELGNPGQVYVVNGHNSREAAGRLQIPSMLVQFSDATNAASARMQGAIANVSAGHGTVFDAGKLAREFGITDDSQLKAMGKPGYSGHWKEGIAMGRLPEDIFNAAVNEQVKLKQAVAIGSSGQSEEKMRAAYRYIVERGKDSVSADVLARMLKRPTAAPEVMAGDVGGQTRLPGFDDYDATFEAQAKLEAAIVSMLKREKNLFGMVGRKSEQIGRVAQGVDAAAAKGISSEAEKALTVFDRLVYLKGPIMDLLNEGTPKVIAGQLPSDVAAGLKNRLTAAIKAELGQEVAPVTDAVQEDIFGAATRQADQASAPVELTQAQRDAGEMQVLQQAISSGEVRPYNSPLPELPEPAQVRLDQLTDEPLTPGSKQAQAVADEIRLAVEHKQMDAAMQFEQRQALRDAVDYEGLAFDEKKGMGMAAGLDEVPTPEANTGAAMGARQAEALRKLTTTIKEASGMADEDAAAVANFYLAKAKDGGANVAKLDPVTGQFTIKHGAFLDASNLPNALKAARQWQSSLAPAPIRPEPLQLTAPANQPELLLPQDLSKASPRYGVNTITFQSDLDRAAYVLANDAVKPSKSAVKFRQVVKEAGLNLDEVVAHGKRVKAALKQAAKGNPGQIELPAQPWRRSEMGDEMFSAGMDWTSIDTGSKSGREIEANVREIRTIIKQVAGDEVDIRFNEAYVESVTPRAWGGDGSRTSQIAGVYRFSQDLIEINNIGNASRVNLIEASFHESFHRIQFVALSAKDRQALEGVFARLKTDLGARIDGIAYLESQAVAFQRYARARFQGEDPIAALVGADLFQLGRNPTKLEKAATAVIGAFDKIADFVERTINAFKGSGFTSVKDIFERAYEGSLRNASWPVRSSLHDDPYRQAHLKSWQQQTAAGAPVGRGDGQRIQNQIDAIDQSMNDIRRKAQQEGC